jgi:uncharacterized phage protein gp47/JayE
VPTPAPSLAPLIIVVPALTGIPAPGVLSIDTTVLPYVILTDLSTSQVEFSIYNTTYINQGAVPTPVSASVTSVEIVNNVLTVGFTLPANAAFPQPNTVVTLAGTDESFLNGQQLTVLQSNIDSLSASYTLPATNLIVASVAAAVNGTTVYTLGGSPPQTFGTNYLVGLQFKFSNFPQPQNNGTFTVVANAGNMITVNNASGVPDTAGVATSSLSNISDSGTATWTNQNTFMASIPVDPTQPLTFVQIIGRNYDPTVAWTASTTYNLGQRLADPNGNVQVVVQAGTSGTTEPTWNQTLDGITNDPTVAGVQWENEGALAITPIFKFQLLYYETSDALVIAPPSAFQSYKGLNSCRIEWQLPTYQGFIGVRLMVSTDPAGIDPPYIQYGNLVNNQTREANVVISSNSSTLVNDNQTVITTTESTQTVNYSSVDIPLTYFSNLTNQEFYALISTVIQDPNTQTIYESQQNGPITCGFVNLRLVQPTDFLALQRKEDIAGRLIASINKVYPALDLTPRSEARDLMIDPIALELANQSVREWFARCSVSISAISYIDNVSGNGISDPFNQSPFKQQIARAYGLSATDTQNLISKQFDILGEDAGLTRLSAAGSTGTVTFFTYSVPTTSTTFPVGVTLSSVADAQTPALNFQTTGSGTITPATASSYYNPQEGRWEVTIPANSTSTGSATNVGEGTIRVIASGGPGGWSVTNEVSFAFGTDNESNANFAARIADALVAGFDSGTRYGYKKAARATPGVVDVLVVAAGDLEMLRDWDPVRQKHVFGCVDIYVEGTQTSDQEEEVFFTYQNTGTFNSLSTYCPLTLLNAQQLKFSLNGFSTLAYLPYTAVQLQVNRTGVSPFYLGVETAQFDNVNGNIILNPNELCYQINGSAISEVRVPLLIAGQPATNLTAVTALISGLGSNYSFSLFAREESPLIHIPVIQPIQSVNSVTGNGPTGLVPPGDVQLIHTSNFFLNGLSQNAGDTVEVDSNISAPVTANIVANTTSPVLIDSAMDVPINSNGTPQNILSVRSSDLSQLYVFGVDYSITAFGPYHQYALNVLQQKMNITQIGITGNILTATCPVSNLVPGETVTFANIQNAVFLNGVSVTVLALVGTAPSYTGFTATYNYAGTYGPAPDSGAANYTTISTGQTVVVAYNKFVLAEQLTFVSQEQQTLNGSIATPLNNLGFVYDTWLPESYEFASDDVTPGTKLTLDGAVYNTDQSLNLPASIIAGSVYSGTTFLGYSTLIAAQVPHDSRYIKVTYNDGVGDIVKIENIDFTLTVDPTSGQATLTRILTGTIPDGGTVEVSYFCNETFDVSTEYPSFVQILTNTLALPKAAGASVLVKAMVANQVNVTATVELQTSADAATVDPNIRTAIDIAMDNAVGALYQSNIVSAIQSVTGVQNVQVPLITLAKANGAYDIGIIIPTDTTWLPLSKDPEFVNQQVPLNAFITAGPVLPDNTIPSGGLPGAAVGLLYQGQEYRRAVSVQDFLANSTVPSFYIIGLNDQINATTPIPSYALRILITEPAVPNPGLRSYICTYQTFNQGGAKDIVMSSTEFLVPGSLTLLYETAS